jgi:hypothetical protein
MTETLVLPTEIVPRLTDSPENMIIYSKHKVGKTTQLAKLNNCLIIDLEKGTNKIDALKVQANSLKELADIIRAIKASEHKYDYVAVDTITELEAWCEWDATKTYMNLPIGVKFNRIENNMKQPKDWVVKPRSQWDSCLTLPKGAGYLHLRNSFKKWLNILMSLAPHVIFVAHVKDSMIEKDGKEVSVRELDLTGKIKNITAQKADAIGYVYWDQHEGEDTLMISFSSSDGAEGNSRCEHLKNATMPFEWDRIFINK